MTPAELSLAALVIGLLGVGGGVWAGSRGKVTGEMCEIKHTNMDRRLESIEKKLDRLIERKPNGE